VAREQHDEQSKNVQPRPKKPTRGQHREDESPHYEPQQEHPSVKHKGDEQAVEHEEAQTQHETESRSHTCDEAQEQPSDLCMTNKWQETSLLRTKSVNLMPNSREMIEESINGIITLTKSLIMNLHPQHRRHRPPQRRHAQPPRHHAQSPCHESPHLSVSLYHIF
jgi:hypothetical protein